MVRLICGVLFLTAASVAQAVLLPKEGPASPVVKKAALNAGNLDSKAGQGKYKDGEVIIKYKNTSAAEFSASSARSHRKDLHRKHGSESVKEFRHHRMELVRLQKGVRIEDAIRSYLQDPAVEYVERNYVRRALATVNDTLFTKQWDFSNTGQTGGKTGADMKMPQAWDISKGSNDVVVMVIDTGVDYNHEDLAANMWVNPGETAGDGIDNDGNGYIDDVYGIDAVNADSDPMDDNGHGTHVAGTIGAVGNNLLGISGINQNIRIIGCKFLDINGSGADDGAIQCLEYARDLRDKGVNIVATNNSWGGGGYSQALESAIRDQGDILFIAAAGNEGTNNDVTSFYPANYNLPNLITVSATDHNAIKPIWGNTGRTTVEVSAPGVNIVSLRAAGTDIYGDGLHFIPDGDQNAMYYRASGTSMATPHVTGLAALIKAWNPSLDWKAIKNLIISGADPVTSLESQTITGRRINAYGSLTCTDKPTLAFLGLQPTGYSGSTQSFPVLGGQNTTLSVLSINCQSPVGPVTATASNGQSFTLQDDGFPPDQVAGDGIFTASYFNQIYVPVNTLTISSPAGTVTVPHTTIPRYLPEANIHASYQQTITNLDGIAPYTWSLVSGSLPDGLQLNSATGAIYGTPLKTGSYPFQVRVIDSLGRSTSEQLSIKIADDFIIEPAGNLDHSGLNSTPRAVALDAAGNSFVAGYYENPATGGWDMAIKKYDPVGKLLWSRFRSNDSPWGMEWATSVAVDSTGALYVAGGYPYAGIFTYDPAVDIFVVKYDTNGNQLWAKTIDSGGCEHPERITVDLNDNLIITGMKELPPIEAPIFYQRNREVVTIKMSPDGQLAWIQNYRNGLFNSGNAVASDKNGNIYVTGYSMKVYESTVDYELYTYSILTIKYDPSGAMLWDRIESADPPSYMDGTAIAVDKDGNSYVGSMMSPTTLFKYDPNGTLIWGKSFSVEGYDMPFVNDLALDVNGDLIAGGYRYDDVIGDWVYYLAKLDSAGDLLWSKKVEGYFSDNSLRLAVDKNNRIHVSRPYNNDFLNSTFEELFYIATPSVLPSAIKGYAYSQTLQAGGGLAPYTWSIASGSLPSGLTLNAATGEVKGTPKAAGTFTFSVTAKAKNLATVKAAFTLVVSFIEIKATTLPFGITGKSYSQTLIAQGTATPFAWKVASGKFPAGLKLDSRSGAITGTPTTVGTSNFTVQVTDKESHSAKAAQTITVYAPLTITTTSLTTGIVNSVYNTTIAAKGGLAPYNWAISSGSLPAGLTIDPATGAILGTPTTAGKSVISVTVTDGIGLTATRQFTLQVTTRK